MHEIRRIFFCVLCPEYCTTLPVISYPAAKTGLHQHRELRLLGSAAGSSDTSTNDDKIQVMISKVCCCVVYGVQRLVVHLPQTVLQEA